MRSFGLISNGYLNTKAGITTAIVLNKFVSTDVMQMEVIKYYVQQILLCFTKGWNHFDVGVQCRGTGELPVAFS